MENVQKILNKLNLSNPIEHETYIKMMESHKDGRLFMDLIDEMDITGSENADWKKIYNAMSKNIDVSEMVACYSNSMIYKEVLAWVDKQNYDPESFMELGCNNGLLSIALSELWGNAKIVGIDYALHAIKAANKLAAKYKIKDFHFFHIDINTYDSFEEIPKVDIIMAPFFFHELTSFQNSNWNAINSNIRLVSNNDTILIAANRFPNPDSECDQLRIDLKSSNFKEINRETIKVKSDHEDRDFEYFPIQVFANN